MTPIQPKHDKYKLSNYVPEAALKKADDAHSDAEGDKS
jgi:hypothetical protein